MTGMKTTRLEVRRLPGMGSRSQAFFAIGRAMENRSSFGTSKKKMIKTIGAPWHILINARVLRTSFNKTMMNRVDLVNKKVNKTIS